MLSCLYKIRSCFKVGNHDIYRVFKFVILRNGFHVKMSFNTGKYRPERQINADDGKNTKLVRSREESSEQRLQLVIENDRIDQKYGFERFKEPYERNGFLINMHSGEILDEDKRLVAALDFYFIEEDGNRFKVSLPFKTYFYILTKREFIQEVSQYLMKKYSGIISSTEVVKKEDLDLANHLVGLKQHYLKVSFFNQNDLMKVRRELMPRIKKNKEREKSTNFYTEMLTNALAVGVENNIQQKITTDHLENIMDIREHDIPYHMRVSIDLRICCGSWYTVKGKGIGSVGGDTPSITLRADIIERPEPIVLAFDIETTKLPLKFPDSNTDQIMMISYMIDGQGYLITNREIISADIADFEYTPKPEYEGHFTIHNAPNESVLLSHFFNHIMEVRPHIFVTYNGDSFDWPFVEARAAAHDLDMRREIGFGRGASGPAADNAVYSCRPAMHMDCFCWVKRDSYLPMGSMGLKAVTKAKLRYDPVEVDPEQMCPMAINDPIALSNYSVSDAVATYYLYIQYVHPFIFALCTIIPCEPDEVLRKGSGTLCEALLMVKATEADIIYPNKQQSEFNKLTHDGHVLHQETYVGGHVEALESGVFRADIPCRFRIDTEAITQLISQLPATLHHAIEIEEGVALDQVTNLDEITAELTSKLQALREQPMRLERPLIYHLDVGAMYPNIILTNRLQPYAPVTETICAACDYNKVNAKCKRNMIWMSREEYMPANRNEYQRIQQQLETERFPPQFSGGPQRAFHQLPHEEQANLEKNRLAIYCRKVYKKQKITRMEEKCTTICQKEHSFYVDTVRAFRDRRYEYKALSKTAKFDVVKAIKGGDASEIKSAKNKEVLYESLQTAHKCILNSFYGYVMRRGARWHSMEMGGIVCYTGAHIITRAREIIDKIGRPLELDTDGIWCILPVSFPENVTVRSTHNKKPKFNISYPNAVLNAMVKECFTNDQYHELVDKNSLKYELRQENTIFFEVDGPYKAMVLPASKEEGKKLKKRYAVFNFDGSLAELKGFEVKRRGELQLIKNFQSSVFEAFLKGDSLESCYASVAQVANFWLDVLYSKGVTMPDDELFALISENRSMSKRLEEYGSQKSTSISTAKRLAEFLGDQMVKDAGLACKYVVAKKPIGAPVTERAIPLAIFQTEEAVQKYYLRKWLKDPSFGDANIRDIVDWNYYIERLGGTIQKIITIPAAMQGISNPVPRIRHPDWLHKKILEKNDIYKQRRIDDMFSKIPKRNVEMEQENDIEDLIGGKNNTQNVVLPRIATVTKRKRKNESEFDEDELTKSWKDVFGNPPPYGKTKEELIKWIEFHKKKWRFQHMQKNVGVNPRNKRAKNSAAVVRTSINTLGGFIQRSQRSLLTNTWQVLQISPTSTLGEFRLWALVQSELHLLKLIIPRQFYANIKTPKQVEEGALFKKCNRTLPRARKVHYLYQYSVPEEIFQEHGKKLYLEQTSASSVSGVFETQIPPLFRALVQLGCVCRVNSSQYKTLQRTNNQDHTAAGSNTFQLDQLEMSSLAKQPYLPRGDSGDVLKRIYMYHHRAPTGKRQMFAVFLTPAKKAVIVVVDSVRTNMMPNMTTMYSNERIVKMDRNPEDDLQLPDAIDFEIKVETDLQNVYKIIQKALQAYKDEKNGPTLLAIQAVDEIAFLQSRIANIIDFPVAQIHLQGVEDLYNNLEWQRNSARSLIRHYLNHERVLDLMIEQCRYLYVPIGNMAADSAILGADIFYARNLVKHNHVLWASTMDRPDLGGAQENDARLLAESQESSSEVCNQVGWYSSVCVELDIDSLAINTLLQSHHVTDLEGTSVATAFDQQQSAMASVADVAKLSSGDNVPTMNAYDESARCVDAFRILRTMASSWMRDISLHRNVYADFQVVHFYRWLRSSKSLLYDPALLRTLQNLMKKLFMQLVAEFKRLGCKVIYANFNKIIVCSKKHTVQDAIENIEFVVTSIRNKELFHSLDISYRQCWEQLIWLDTANYAGIQGKIPQDVEDQRIMPDNSLQDPNEERENDDDDEEEDNEPVVVMNWNIAESLPETAQCRASFNAIIAGYINAVHSQLINQARGTQCPKNVTVTSQPEFGLITYPSVLDFAKELLNGEISQNLFRIIEKIKDRLPKVENGRSTALDFINALCHIFSLDPALNDTVQHMKSNLLRLIGVGEFGEETVFKDRSVSYVVPQVICRACNHCRDLDIGRDAHCNLCPLCRTPYDMDLIESFLLDTVTCKLLAYNLQDLQCTKCRQIKMENMMNRCQCAGDFIGLISRDELLKLFETFENLAQLYKMPALQETVHQILMLV